MQPKLNKLIDDAVDDALNQPEWPDEFINSDTKKVYQPRNEEEIEFVYGHKPRYFLVRGGEGCIAAETKINGVPAAEWSGGSVTTLYGLEKASPIYPKGYADLYQIQTKLGHQVTVTLDHRFLTPFGWGRLRNLDVGHLIAVHDTERDPIDFEKSTNYLDSYSKGLHPYGELSSPQAVDVLDKLRQLANFPYAQWNHEFSAFSSIDRLYRRHYPILWEPHLLHLVLEYFYALNGVEMSHPAPQTDWQLQPKTGQIDTFQSWLLTFADQVSSRGVDHEQYRQHEYGRKHHYESGQRPFQFQHRNSPGGAFLESFLSFPLTSYFNTNIRCQPAQVWDTIEEVKFIKHGEYYDLTVPGAEHYLANGIYHHNSGKTVSGVMKTLHKLRKGMSGVMVSPNLPHFARSLWPEFRRWCPWDLVVPEHRYRGKKSWEPYRAFTLYIRNELGTNSFLICGGIENPITFEGPNLHFAYVDEMRGCEDDEVIKVLTGRTRLKGPNGEPPQFYSTSTPRMHFMYDYFGPIDPEEEIEDKYLAFKERSKSIVFTTEQAKEAGFVDEEYVESRGAALNESEKRVRLYGEWEDEENENRFLESVYSWDALQDTELPSLAPKHKAKWHDVLVLGVDAAVSRDYFALVGVTRHPENRDNLAVRICKVWTPPKGGKIDFQGTENNPGPELFIRNVCERHAVVVIVYDQFQLHDMMTRLGKEGIAWCKTFSQHSPRAIADQQLYDYIISQRIFHDGNPVLRQHIQNAGSKVDDELHKRRIVKLEERKKIDAAVALSMASFEASRLNL